MNNIENIEFETIGTADEISGNDGKEIVNKISGNGGELLTVDENEVKGSGEHERNGKKRGKYKQLTWEKYADIQTAIFDNLELAGSINATLTINSIPNEREFHDLATVLKDEYTPGATEYIIAATGWNNFYIMYKTSGLFDVVGALKEINRSFRFEKIGEHKIRIGESIQAGRAEKRVVIHISGQQKREIQRLLQDIKVPESNFGLMCCISTFNRAKEKFEDRFITENYEAYYDDDGYIKIIKNEMDQATNNGIDLLVEYLESMFWEIESKINEYLNNPYADPKLIRRISAKRKAMNKTISTLEKTNTNMPVKSQLFISSFKEDLETVPLKD